MKKLKCKYHKRKKIKRGHLMPILTELRTSNVQKVQGKIRNHEVQLVTISTCIWCKRLKKRLNENNIEYEYADIDLLPSNEKIKLNV